MRRVLFCWAVIPHRPIRYGIKLDFAWHPWGGVATFCNAAFHDWCAVGGFPTARAALDVVGTRQPTRKIRLKLLTTAPLLSLLYRGVFIAKEYSMKTSKRNKREGEITKRDI